MSFHICHIGRNLKVFFWLSKLLFMHIYEQNFCSLYWAKWISWLLMVITWFGCLFYTITDSSTHTHCKYLVLTDWATGVTTPTQAEMNVTGICWCFLLGYSQMSGLELWMYISWKRGVWLSDYKQPFLT